jgi:hypothetical protein
MSLRRYLAVGLFVAALCGTQAIAQERPKPACDQQGCSVEWAAKVDGNWKWVSVTLSQSEADSLASALKEASDQPVLHIHMVRDGENLTFLADKAGSDKASTETADKLQQQALFRIKDFRFRVVPEGTAYPLLRNRMKS